MEKFWSWWGYPGYKWEPRWEWLTFAAAIVAIVISFLPLALGILIPLFVLAVIVMVYCHLRALRETELRYRS